MWWLWFLTAFAGDLTVHSAVPVQVTVDGEAIRYSSRTMKAVAEDLKAGTRVVEVREHGARRAAVARVNVPRVGEVAVRYADGELSLLDTLGVEDEDAAWERAGRRFFEKVSDRILDAAPPADTATPAVVPDLGSVLIAGADGTSGRVWIAGQSIEYSPAAEGFVAEAVPAGKTPVRIEESGRLRYEGAVEVRAGWTHRCLPKAQRRGVDLDCHWIQGLLEVAPPQEARRPSKDTRPRRPHRPSPYPMPVPELEPEPPSPMDASTLRGVVGSVEGSAFSDEKLDILRTAAAHHYVTIAQLGALMDLFAHSTDKVDAVRILRDRVVDPANAHLLSNHLTFSDDKAQVQALFR